MSNDSTNQNGRDLRPCPGSPNCVCSDESRPAHAIEPFQFSGEAAAAWDALHEVLLELPRIRVVKESESYLHAEARSGWLRFVDDIEFSLRRDQRVIAVRSASRVGYSDLGVNRARIERLRRLLRERNILA